MWSNISAPKSGLKAAHVGHQKTNGSSEDSLVLSLQENGNNNCNYQGKLCNSTTNSKSEPLQAADPQATPVVHPEKVLAPITGSSPVMRYKHAVCSCETTGYIYIHGGRFGNGLQLDDDIWRFDPHHNSWLQLQTGGCKPPSLQEHTLIEHGNQLYMFGGQVSAASGQEKSFWRLDLASNQWWSLDMKSGMKYGAYLGPTNRRGHCACVYRNSMYVFGGYEDFRGSSSQLWQYDLLNERWELCNLSSTSACHPEPRHSHSAVVYNDSMYVYGGLSNLKPLGDLWRWSWKDKRWYRERTRGPGPGPLHGHTAIQAFGSMFVFGGERQNGRTTRSLWRLNLNNLCWQKVRPKGPRPNPTTWHVAVANPMNMLDGANYLIEGALDQNQELALYDELAGSCGPRSFSDNCFQPAGNYCNQQQQQTTIPMETIPIHPSSVANANINNSCSRLGQQQQVLQPAKSRVGLQSHKGHTLSHSKSATSGEQLQGVQLAPPGPKPKSKRKLSLKFLRAGKHKSRAIKLEAGVGASGGGNGKQGPSGKSAAPLPSSWSVANIVNGLSSGSAAVGVASSSLTNKRHHSVTPPECGSAAAPVDAANAGNDVEMTTINENNQQVSAKILDTLDTDIKQMFEESALGGDTDNNENRLTEQSSDNIKRLPAPEARMARDSMTQSQLSSYVGQPSLSGADSKMTSLASSQTFQTAREQLTSYSTLTITNANINGLGQVAKTESEVQVAMRGAASRLGDIRQRRSMQQFNSQGAAAGATTAAASNRPPRKPRPKSEIVQLIDDADARIKNLYTPLFHPNQHSSKDDRQTTLEQQQQEQRPFNSNDPIFGHLQNHPMFERISGKQRTRADLVDKSKRHTIHQTNTYYNLYFAEEYSDIQQQQQLRRQDRPERRPPPTSSSQQVISPRRQDDNRKYRDQLATDWDTTGALVGVRGGSSADSSSIATDLRNRQNQQLLTSGDTTADTSLSSSLGGSHTLCEANPHDYEANGRHPSQSDLDDDDDYGYMNGADDDDDVETAGGNNNYQRTDNRQARPAGSEMGGDSTSIQLPGIAELVEDDMLQYSSPTDPNMNSGRSSRKSSSDAQVWDEYEEQFDGDNEEMRRSRAGSRMQLDQIDSMVGPRGDASTEGSRMPEQRQSHLIAQKSTSSGYESIRSNSTANDGHDSPSINNNIDSNHNYNPTANEANNEQYKQRLVSNGTEAQANHNNRVSNGNNKAGATSSTTVDSLTLTTITSTSFQSNSNSIIRVHSPPCKSLPLSSSSAEDELLMLHLRDNNNNNNSSNGNNNQICDRAVDGRLLDGRQLSCNYAINRSCNSGPNDLSHSRSITSRLFSKKRANKTRYWQLCMFVIGGKQQPGAGSHASGGMLNEPINVWRLYI